MTATGLTPAQITLAKGIIAGSVNLVIGLATEPSSISAQALIWVLLVGGFGYGASIILWVTSARRLGAARSEGLFATAPFVGMTLGWLVTDERVLGSQLMALAVMAIGVSLVVSSAHVHEHRHAADVHTHRHRHDDDHHEHVHTPPVQGWHTHEHEHAVLVHAHPHVPDESRRHQHR